MDRWTDREVAFMKAGGGNTAVRTFLIQHGLEDFDHFTIRQKYDSPQGELLRQVLKARVDGLEEPTTLPSSSSSAGPVASSSAAQPTQISAAELQKRMQGFGSNNPPLQSAGNSQAQNHLPRTGLYVAAATVVVLGVTIWWGIVPHS
jgi:hypothetical protein